ncbi:MAG: hypothetical protein HY736_10465 [Verrucomicrobia bacterium]|nr:hypothetical protein [Verrucomicrobiota bacterium]
MKLVFHGVYGCAGSDETDPASLGGDEAEGDDAGASLTAAMGAGEAGATAIGTAVGVKTAAAASRAAAATFGPTVSRSNCGDAGTGSWGAMARVVRPRFAVFRRSWRLSHCRKASSEISTPRPRRPLQSTATDSPARRNRSSSSRCGSSCIVFGCFGQRALATNSASVGSASGAMWWCAGGSEGVILERYSERPWSAMGGVLPWSKPRGLDVGVLTYFFLWFFLNRFSSLKLLLRLSLWILRLVEDFQFCFGELVLWVRVGFFSLLFIVGWNEWMIRCFGSSISCSLSLSGLSGGGSC